MPGPVDRRDRAGNGPAGHNAVGVVEVVAGVVVAGVPRFGGWLVAAWLGGIVVNLLSIPGFYDIALRDFGLLIGAVALARLAVAYAPARRTGTES